MTESTKTCIIKFPLENRLLLFVTLWENHKAGLECSVPRCTKLVKESLLLIQHLLITLVCFTYMSIEIFCNHHSLHSRTLYHFIQFHNCLLYSNWHLTCREYALTTLNITLSVSSFKLMILSETLLTSTILLIYSSFNISPTLFYFLSTPW